MYVAVYIIKQVSSKYARPPSNVSIARQILLLPDIAHDVSSVIAYNRPTMDGHRARRRSVVTQDPKM
jgi:hypothetical protein